MGEQAWLRALATVLAGTLLAGCTGTRISPDQVPYAAGESVVVLRNFQFQPRQLTVRVGTTITFVNQDADVHDVVQVAPAEAGKAKPAFASPPLPRGGRWQHTFTETGEFPLVCMQGAHYTAGMTGVIRVVP